jgi:GTPase
MERTKTRIAHRGRGAVLCICFSFALQCHGSCSTSRIRKGDFSIQKIFGNTLGLKPGQTRSIERIYRRRIPHTRIFTPELVRYLSEVSHETGRQIGLLADRRGYIQQVIVGDARQILLPQRNRHRAATERLSGIRYLHTHLHGEPLDREDLTDLSLLRFDCILAVEVDALGFPRHVHMATLVPGSRESEPWQVWPPLSPAEPPPVEFSDLIRNLEKEFTRTARPALEVTSEEGNERAILVGVCTGPVHVAERSIQELRSLAESCGVSVRDSIVQRRPVIHPQFVAGRGKLKDLVIQSLQSGAEMIIFDHDLTPAQMRSIADFTELKILDRTQLILELFAQRAKTRGGKIQVELAQLRYRLPRLSHRDAGLSRLMGGIGGRGPGESKLEIDRRRVRERIHRLEKEIDKLRKGRQTQKGRRDRNSLPLVCLVGYTNAGKSTLLNALTRSRVYTEDRLFATLDPTTRRLCFSEKRTALVTDTVGFIRNLPPDLITAFRATLDELQDADLLIHVIDGASEFCEEQATVVRNLLESLDLHRIPCLNVFNKSDRADPVLLRNLCRRYDAVPASALHPASLSPLTDRMQLLLFSGRTLSRLPAPPDRSPLRGSSREDAQGCGGAVCSGGEEDIPDHEKCCDDVEQR